MGALVPKDDLPGTLVPVDDLPDGAEPPKDTGPLAGMSTPDKILAGVGGGMVKVGRNAWDIATGKLGQAIPPSINPFGMAGRIAEALGHPLEHSAKDWEEWRDANKPLLAAKWSAEHLEAHKPQVPASMLTGDPETDARLQAAMDAREREGGGPGKLGMFLGETAATLPIAAGAGKIVKTALGPATSLAQRLLAAGGAGAAEGGIVGATTVDDPEQRARAALGGAMVGGGVGAAIPAAGAILRPVAEKASEALHEAAISQGRKALSGVSNPLAARKPIAEAAVQQALDTGAIRPLAGVEGIAKRLGLQEEALGSEYGKILDELAAKGVKGPNAVVLAKQIAADAAQAQKTSLGSVRPRMLRAAAQELQGKVPSTSFAPKELDLLQAEEIKRNLQAEARREYDKIARQFSTAGETKKELASTMRQAIEDAVQQQAPLAPEAASRFLPVKEKLANTLQALQAADEGAARAARRGPVSLTSTIVGAATGEATRNPWLAIPAALLHGTVKHRLPSTTASIANALSKGLAPATAAATSEPASNLAAFLAALKERGGSPGLAPGLANEPAATTGTTTPAPAAPAAGSVLPGSQPPSVTQPGSAPLGLNESRDTESEPHQSNTDKLAEVLRSNPAALGPYAAPLAARLKVGGPMAVTQYDFIEQARNPAYRAHRARVIGDERLKES